MNKWKKYATDALMMLLMMMFAHVQFANWVKIFYITCRICLIRLTVPFSFSFGLVVTEQSSSTQWERFQIIMFPLFPSSFSSSLAVLIFIFVIRVQSLMIFEEEITTQCDPHFPTSCWTPDIDASCFSDSRSYLDAFHSTNKTKWALQSTIFAIYIANFKSKLNFTWL